MTELERLLRLQLQQSQQQVITHQAEVAALQAQLNDLKTAWEHSATSYSALFNEQQKSLEAYKQQIERVQRESLETYKQQIESAFQNLHEEVKQQEANTNQTLSKVENSLLGLTMQLNGLTKQLKR